MAIKKISEFVSAVPSSDSKILFEQNEKGKSCTIGDAVNTCSLSYEEIMASTDLSGKVASASALQVASLTIGAPDYSKAVLIDNTLSGVDFNYIAPSNGIIVASGYGTGQNDSYIFLSAGPVSKYIQGVADEHISNMLPIAKGDTIRIKTALAAKNFGTYFIPYK